MSLFNSSQFKGSLIIGAIIVIVVLSIIKDGLFFVPAGHVGVIFDQGRGVLPKAFPEGLHFKIPFWQQGIPMNIRTQEYTMSIAPKEGSLYGDDSVESRSKDGQIVKVDATVLFHIEADKAPIVYQKIGNANQIISIIVRPKTREVIRNIVGKYNALDLVSEKRDELTDLINKKLKLGILENNINLENLLIRNITFSPEYTRTIEEKQIEFEKIKTAEYQKQQAEQLKLKKIIEAEGEAEAIRLKAVTLKSNPGVIQYEFVQKIAPNIKWGILPQGITPILNMQEFTDSISSSK